jgi:LEA14-like dessication related protein
VNFELLPSKLAVMKKLFALLLVVSILTSCTVYKDVEVKEVLDFKVIEFRSDGAECEIFLTVYNPNGYKITLTESQINMVFEGKPLGEVHLKEKLVIPKKSQSTISLKCTAQFASLSALTGDLLSLLFKTEYVMEGSGHIKGKALLVSKKVPITFKETLTKADLGF